jgi:hypothetical protein
VKGRHRESIPGADEIQMSEPMKDRKLFVSYVYTTALFQNGTGSTSFLIGNPVSFSMLLDLQNHLEKSEGFKKVVITNWNILEA